MLILRPWSTESPERRWAMRIAIVCFIILIALPFLPEVERHTEEKNLAKTNITNKQITPINAQKTTSINTIVKPAPLHTKQDSKKTIIPVKPHIIIIKNTQKHTSPISSQGYFIQVGAFKDQNHAQKLQKQLIKKRWSVIIQKKKHLYAVQVGPYKNRTTANKIKKQLFSKTKINGFITHHAYP